jgi:Bacterial RNA polymerase, alpha chain C terminal domain
MTYWNKIMIDEETLRSIPTRQLWAELMRRDELTPQVIEPGVPCVPILAGIAIDPSLLARVDELDLSTRAQNCLKNDNVVHIGDLVTKDEWHLRRMPNFGRKSLKEINELLALMNLRLGLDIPGWPPAHIGEDAEKLGYERYLEMRESSMARRAAAEIRVAEEGRLDRLAAIEQAHVTHRRNLEETAAMKHAATILECHERDATSLSGSEAMAFDEARKSVVASLVSHHGHTEESALQLIADGGINLEPIVASFLQRLAHKQSLNGGEKESDRDEAIGAGSKAG